MLDTLSLALIFSGVALTLAQAQCRKVGGIWFFRYGPLCLSFCLSQKY